MAGDSDSARAQEWRRLDAALARLLALEPAEAAHELEQLDAEQAPWRARLERALAAARGEEGPLAGSAIESWPELLAGAAAPTPASGLGPGALLGRWRIAGELGHGGMGTVYAVERADGVYAQRAALKLLRIGVDEAAAGERFRRERQILARLEHPAIARLLDGGVALDGRPYLVLERVDGEPITEWCDRRRLGVEARLELFLAVLDAVDFAHRSLVVHRDLKPSNVLVSATGEVKLLDFGIAKLLSDTEAGDLTRSRDGAPLTPQYAAPEQVTGAAVTTATDVYALGILLYELLAGERPYRLASDSALELERQIVAGDTAPPSRAAAHAAPAVATGRATTAERLARRLAGDLDAIVLKALAKEPERRYAGAAALARDLAAHLAGRPVEARPDSLAYRAAKFVRRHRMGVASGAALVALLVAGLAAAAVALVASRARLVEARRAEAIKDFLVNLFAEVDPAQGTRPELTLAEVLAAGERRLATELADQPRTRAELLLTLGTIERNLGRYERAAPLLEEAQTLTAREFGPESPELGRVLLQVGDLHYWHDSAPAALAAQRRAAAIFTAAGPAFRADLASARYNVGVALRELGRYEEALAEERAALALERELHGPESLEVAEVADGLALLLHSADRDAQALPYVRQALAIRRRHLTPDHPSVAKSLNSLAVALVVAGRLEEATRIRREAYELATRLYEPGDSSLAVEANNLAVLCYRQQDWSCAESGFRAAMADWRVALGEGHAHTASARNNLGMTLLARGRAREALPEIEAALAVRREVYGAESTGVAQSLRNLGLVRLALGDFAGAASALGASVEMSRRVYPERHPRLAESLAARAELALAQNRREDAVRDLTEALAIRAEKLGAAHAETDELRRELERARGVASGGAPGRRE